MPWRCARRRSRRLVGETFDLWRLAAGSKAFRSPKRLARQQCRRESDAMLSLTVVATVFAVVFIAELPDKSLFASLVLGTRYKARWVWVGVSAAFVVHVVIAVAKRAPRRPA